ncbi:MAG: endonuclease domain-containing protein [Chitinophagaceae bacterium]
MKVEKEMFYKAGPLIFKRAKELRNNVTHAEMIVWGYLKTKPGGYKFRRQHPLLNYIADFFCFKLKLVIEIDGPIHNSEEARKNDEERQKIIESTGLKIIRFTNEEVMKYPQNVIKKIQLTLHEQFQEKAE